jgi:hypothetical protein
MGMRLSGFSFLQTILFQMCVLQYAYSDVYVQSLTSAPVSIFVWFAPFSLLPPPPLFQHKEKVDNVVLYVSTFTV